MDLKTDLIYRCSKALDALVQMTRPDGTFSIGASNGILSRNSCSMPVRLQTISFLYSAADIFDKKYLRDIADLAFSRLETQCFQKDDACCLIENGESIGFWNAMMAIIHFKRNEEDKAILFIRSLLECIKDDKVVCHYASGTTDEILKANVNSPYGIFILPMLQTKDKLWEVPAKQVADYIIKSGKYDYLDLWGLKKLSEISNIPKFRNHASHLLNAINRTPPDSMSSLYAGAIMQANLAWYDDLPNFQGYKEDRIGSILKRQLSCQDMKTGAFSSVPNGQEIKPEYIVHNIIALVEYLVLVEKWDEADLSIIA